MAGDLVKLWSADYEDFLKDESRRIGAADSISFPASEAEVIDVVKAVRAENAVITLQGARTGIVAGAVPQGGHVLNLSRMNAIGDVKQNDSGVSTVKVQPGVSLDDIRAAVSAQNLFFPPDPTETTALIGGMVASNASGAMSFFYGPTRKWVEALRVVLSDGSVVNIRRGNVFAQGRQFEVITEDGRIISGSLPSYNVPNVKSAAGYFVADDMDMIDLFIGMEGTLGIITEIEIRLIPQPQAISGLTIFLPSEDAALRFVRYLRGEDMEGAEPLSMRPVAIEFFNSDALNLLRNMKTDNPAFAAIPALRPHYHTAIYVEFHGNDDNELETAVMEAMEAAIVLGASDEDTWYATTERELEPQKAFRHAIPEAVNLLIGERKRDYPSLVKLGTDMSVPDEHLEAVIEMYNSGLLNAGLESVIFGHIGNNHVHVNILPRNMDEYDQGKAMYLEWAQKVVAMGGSVSAEHGIGKIKAPFLRLMYSEEEISQMRELKKLFDPDMVLNPGNLF